MLFHVCITIGINVDYSLTISNFTFRSGFTVKVGYRWDGRVHGRYTIVEPLRTSDKEVVIFENVCFGPAALKSNKTSQLSNSNCSIP